MGYVTDHRVLKTFTEFRKSNITLIEWETPLLQRMGYPLALKDDLIFLVPDGQIQRARQIVEGNGLSCSDQLPGYLSEWVNKGFRYVYDDEGHRFMLVPLSWTGIKEEERQALNSSARPCPLWTVPIPALCTAYLCHRPRPDLPTLELQVD
ncbi:unnamed protein product [Fusarium langsethiae]|nr:unnamed protein product [Fusarium langsethiae]